MRFGKGKVAKKKFHSAKETINNWDVNIDNTVIWKLIEAKTISKYLVGCLNKFIRLSVLIMPKMIGFHKTFKVKGKTINWCLSTKIMESY